VNKILKLAIWSFSVLLLTAGLLLVVTALSMYRRAESEPFQSELIAEQPVATAAPAADWLTEYTLTERSGREFASSELKGQVHVVNFFFASCPSYCRMQTMEVQKLAAEFGPQGVKFLSITVDPERDTAAELARYADLFNADPNHWLFLTGDLLMLRRVGAEMYQLPVDKQMHTEHLVVVDRWGKIRGRIRWKDNPTELASMKKLLSDLLVEAEPPVEVPAAPASALAVEDDEDGAPGPLESGAQPVASNPNGGDDAAAAPEDPRAQGSNSAGGKASSGGEVAGPQGEPTPGLKETGPLSP
jgi:protein SCO1/2